jgi:hypothetical protein
VAQYIGRDNSQLVLEFDIKSIVTHPGNAHFDEFMSCCLLLAAGKANRIYRRRHTDEDLANPDVLVLDQGGVHDPALSNFDHHQFSADHPAACTITLVLPILGVSTRQARLVWNWLFHAEMVDSKGPYSTAKHYGVSPELLNNMVSPVESSVIRLFGSRDFITLEPVNALSMTGYSDFLPQLMCLIGKDWLDMISKVIGRVELLKEEARFYEVEGIPVCDVTSLARGINASANLDLFLREVNKLHCAITITNDERAGGICLYRRGDDPRINFAQLEGQPGIRFVHKNGFVCKADTAVGISHIIKSALTRRR